MSEDVSNTRLALHAFWKAFLRLLLILLLGALIVTLAFWGGPYVYRQLMQPVQALSGRIGGVETNLDQSRADAAALAGRLEDLEAASVADRSRAATQVAGLNARAADLEAALAAQEAALMRLEDLEADLLNLEAQLEEQKAASEGQQAAFDALLTDAGSPLAAARREVQVLKAMQLLNRARLFLLQSNFGLARQDVALSRDILEEARSLAPRADRPRLAAWVARLDLVLAALPDFPVQAADDLETAWRMISADIAILPPTATPTPTLTGTFTPTSFLTGTLTATFTPEGSSTPTPSTP